MILCCTFCNEVFQGTLYKITRHFVQTNYCKDVSDEALYEIARRTEQKFESDQMERVGRYPAERGLDVPQAGGAREGEAEQHSVEGGGGGDGGQGVIDRPFGGGGGDMEEDATHIDHEARCPGEEGFLRHEDMPVFDPAVETHRAELAEELEEVRQPFWVIGATILSNGRKSQDERSIVNFLAAGSRGVIMYMTINREGEPDDVDHVLRRWVTIFHEFRFDGPQCVNAICTDSASADDDSDEERAPKAADYPMLPIPREMDETHDDADDVETRTYTARRMADRAEREMMGGDEDCWGPFGDVASMGDSATAAVETEELASSLPQHGLLQRSAVVRQLRLRSPSPGVLQEEGSHRATPPDRGGPAQAEEEVAAAAAVEGEVAAAAAKEEPSPAEEEKEPSAAAAVEGEVAAAAAAAEEEVAAAAEVPDVAMEHDGVDATEGGEDAKDRLMQEFVTEELDPLVGGFGVARGLGMSPPTGWPDLEMGTHFDFGMLMGGPPSCRGAASTDRAPLRDEVAGEMRTQTPRGRTATQTTAAREVAAAGCEPQQGRGGGVSTSTLDHALRGATRVVHEQTQHKRGVPRPRPVPAEGGVALGESSGAEGLGMPRGSCRQEMVALASTRVVRLRKGGSPVTIEEGDLEMSPAVREEDEEYEGEEESEAEESERGNNDDDPHRRVLRDASLRSRLHPHEGREGRHSTLEGVRGGGAGRIVVDGRQLELDC
ncbi:hypothetical protein CBR_g81564 [Chara braunii]|uniref:Uncharacterized protein n=1 Tax=Chara braunii TaxID=69332 RepID=A0A388KAS5_CHABU|nr:hypothetical protein CBR_g81564 [Chara braunii]|eukprot:GBG67139.1 hypothetical protein CBR_g81564 [Chara braunii]